MRPQQTWDDCGTHAAHSRHNFRGVQMCQTCTDWFREYMRERRRMRGSGRAFTFPIEMPDQMRPLDGLGVAIASAMRESA